jgi:hypothetical protein
LVPFRVYLVNYFAHDGPIPAAICKIGGVVPSLRDGITMVYDKPDEETPPQSGDVRSGLKLGRGAGD